MWRVIFSILNYVQMRTQQFNTLLPCTWLIELISSSLLSNSVHCFTSELPIIRVILDQIPIFGLDINYRLEEFSFDRDPSTIHDPCCSRICCNSNCLVLTNGFLPCYSSFHHANGFSFFFYSCNVSELYWSTVRLHFGIRQTFLYDLWCFGIAIEITGIIMRSRPQVSVMMNEVFWVDCWAFTGRNDGRNGFGWLIIPFRNLHYALIWLLAMLLYTSTVCNIGVVRESSGFGSMSTRFLSEQSQNLRRDI